MKLVSRNIKALLPVKKALWYLTAVAAMFQSMMLCYNHLMGIYPIKDAVTFWATLILGSFIATLAGLALAIPDYHAIEYLEKRLAWGHKTVLRLMVQAVTTIIIALAISVLLTLLSESIIGYKEPLLGVIRRNAMIFPVVNLLLISIMEGVLFFMSGKQSREEAQTLSHSLLEARFELLKNQISPHFMFNNLNVLSALIDSSPKRAQLFVDEFSDIYRYVLDTIDKPVVKVVDELDFMKSYFYLLTIRHGEAICLSNSISAECDEMLIPPFALQTVVENAIKHNIAEREKQLWIELGYSDGYLMVANNIQPKITLRTSTGTGQRNLTKRYELISTILPEFGISNNMYIAKLPIINDESSYN